MAKLKRDERLCPFCAETIKAAAIRCRYCQAELTPIDAEPVGIEASEPESDESGPANGAPVDEAVEGESGENEPAEREEGEATRAEEPANTLGSPRLTAILAVLAILAGLSFGVAWWRAETGPADSSPDGTLVGDEARSQAIVAAADLTQRALSYDYRTLANDMEVARPNMTPSFRKKYDATMRQARPNTLKNKIVLQADVVASSVIVATERRARMLVFVNQVTTAETNEAKQANRNSLVVTLVRGKGDWMLSELTALG